MNTQPKKRGRPVGSNFEKHEKQAQRIAKLRHDVTDKIMLDNLSWSEPDSSSTVEQVKDWGRYNHDWQEGFDKGTVTGYESAQSDMKLANKLTLVLTVVNVAILGYLIVKNS